MQPISDACHHFPPEVIQHAVWLYLRFTLSFRNTEKRLVERGLELSDKMVRRWVAKFAPLVVWVGVQSGPTRHTCLSTGDRWSLAVTLGAGQGTKDHDRWRLAREVLERKLSGRRKHSKLPAMIGLVLARPLVSAGMIAAELGVTARAAQDLVGELGLREITGRGRYRAWAVL
jgi:DNA binding protein with HTH domain